MFSDDFDSVLNTGDEEKDLKKLYSVMSAGNEEDDEFIHIGKTTYYKVRKGPHHYRIVSGKKMTDHEFCWKVEKDPRTKRSYFVNGMGDKKWHLPDIYQTPEEKEKELQMLRDKKRREEQAAADRRKALKRGTEKFELSGPGGGNPEDDDGHGGGDTSAPFLLLQNQSQELSQQSKSKNKKSVEGGNNGGEKKSSCPCCAVQ